MKTIYTGKELEFAIFCIENVAIFLKKNIKKLKVLEFDSYSEEWLDFILYCRRGEDTTDYDIVIGGAANDKVFNTVELFFDGLIDKKEALICIV